MISLTANLKICLISCPGVRFPSGDSKLYLKVKIFNSYGITSKLKPKFPLIFYEQFCFVKQFNCHNIKQLLEILSDEEVVIYLINENNFIISKYKCSAKQFLFPKPQLRPKYSKSSRSVLMDCCLLTIAPKLEFTTFCSFEENFNNLELSDNKSVSDSDSVNSS